MHHITTVFRAVGDLANVAAVLFFGWAALTLQNAALFQYEVGGGMPEFSQAALSAILAEPASAVRYAHIAAAWGLAVASAGCAWMLILGVRWHYHLILRTLNR
jgi:hypothetical protein